MKSFKLEKPLRKGHLVNVLEPNRLQLSLVVIWEEKSVLDSSICKFQLRQNENMTLCLFTYIHLLLVITHQGLATDVDLQLKINKLMGLQSTGS